MTRAGFIAELGLAPETADRRYRTPLGQLVHIARARSPLVELELQPLEQLQVDHGLEALAQSDVYAALRELEHADRRGDVVRLETFRIEDPRTKAMLPPLSVRARPHVGRRRRRVRLLRLSRAQQDTLRAAQSSTATPPSPVIATEVRRRGLRGRLGNAVERLLDAALRSQGQGLDARG